MTAPRHDRVLIVDFGSQVTQLIARRVRESGVYCEIHPFDKVDDAFLSTAGGRDSGFVAVHMYEGMAWQPYFHAVEAIMDELDGRPHWGKRHFQSADTLRPRYPDWDRFQAVRAKLDPEGRFANAWTDRVLGTSDG